MADTLLPIRQNTDLVTFTIRVNGQPLERRLPFYSIEVYREVNRIPTACLRLADGNAATGEWPVSSGESFVPGNEIEILAGYHSEEEIIFGGIVTRQAIRVRNQRLELEVECKDKAVRMTTARRSRLFLEQTDTDIIGTILGEYGLAGDLADTPVTHPEMVQYDCTDWDFVISRLEANGLVALVQDGLVSALKPELNTEPLAVIRFGTNLIEFDAEIDARRQYGAVTAQSWNLAQQALVTADGADPGWTTVGDLAPADLAAAAGAEQYVLRHAGSLSQDELQSWAAAQLLRSRMAFVRGRARVQGFSAALPAITAELQALGNRFNGPVWISGVRHEIGGGNWLTDLQLGLDPERHAEKFAVQAPAGAALVAGIGGLHTGVVTQLESDPAGEARVRVKIPSVNPDEEGIWARIAALSASADHGAFFRPELGDEVVVGFLNEDPRQPLILGMLHSSALAPPFEAADANNEKGYVSRSGMKFVFDDELISLTIETPAGNRISLDEDAGELTIADANGNKLLFSSDGIVLESSKDLEIKAAGNLTLEGQINLEAKAGAQFKAEGSAGLEVSSSAVTVVKGSLVQIN